MNSETGNAAIERLARRLFEQHRAGEALTLPPADETPGDIAAARAVQDRLQALYAEEAGDVLAGWKVALTTPVMQQLVGIDHPCEGGIFASRVHRLRADLKAADFVNIGVESEIAVRLDTDLGPAGAPYDRDSAAGAVGACMAAIEIVDDRAIDYGELDAPLLIADNAFNFGCVLGPPVEDWRGHDLAALSGRMEINGETVGQGVGGDVLGHPLEALAWLANALIARGRQLNKGDIVMTGSIVSTKWLKPGDEMVTVIEALGEARLNVS